MKHLPLILLILTAIVIETTFVSFPFSAVVLTITLLFLPEEDIWLLFLSGIIFDLFAQRLVGISSLFFLNLYFIIARYKKKFHGGQSVLKFILTGVIVAIYSFLFSGFVDLRKITAGVVLTGLIFLLTERLIKTADNRKRLVV